MPATAVVEQRTPVVPSSAEDGDIIPARGQRVLVLEIVIFPACVPFSTRRSRRTCRAACKRMSPGTCGWRADGRPPRDRRCGARSAVI